MIVSTKSLRFVHAGRPLNPKFNEMCQSIANLKPGQAYMCHHPYVDNCTLSMMVRGIRGALNLPIRIRTSDCGIKCVVRDA